MASFKWLRNLFSPIKSMFAPVRRDTLQDTAHIKINGLDMEVTRKIGTDVPYEITVVVPRVEIRKKCLANQDGACDCEIILNSITIAHSPRPVSEGSHSASIEIGKDGMLRKNRRP